MELITHVGLSEFHPEALSTSRVPSDNATGKAREGTHRKVRIKIYDFCACGGTDEPADAYPVER